MLTHSQIFLVVILLIQVALFSTAHPTSSTSLSSRVKHTELLKSQVLNGTEYTLVPLPDVDQGSWSDTYKIVEPFKGEPAILKVVPEEKGSKKEIEVRYLKKVNLHLHDEAEPTKRVFFIVSVDVERRPAAPFKPFYKWYLEDEDMNLEESLKQVLGVIESGLVNIAINRKLLYFDFGLENVFVDETLTASIPVDWGPPDTDPKDGGGIAGVEEVKEETREDQLHEFADYLIKYLPRRINIEQLEKALKKRGKKLRPRDAATLAKLQIANA